MPVPLDLLNSYHGAALSIQLEEGLHVRPLKGRAPLPPALAPQGWFVGADDEEGLRQLRTSARQAGYVAIPARVEGEGLDRAGLVMVGMDRARAVRMGYRRGEWLVIGLLGERAELVYTGHNSRDPRAASEAPGPEGAESAGGG